MLESTVQKYRAELASASSNITGKDILISKLDDQVGTRSHFYMYKLQSVYKLLKLWDTLWGHPFLHLLY